MFKNQVKDILLALDEEALREIVRHLTDAGYLKNLEALAETQRGTSLKEPAQV